MATMAAAATRAKPRWGDDDDDDDEDDDEQQQQQQSNEASSRYQPQRSRIDAHGIQYSTTYRDSGNGTRIKVIQKIRVTKELVKESKGVAERRLWKKFGLAASSADSSSTTIPSRDDVYLEDPKAEGGGGDGSGAPEDDTKALSGNLNAFWAKQQRRQLERKYDVAPGSSLNASGAAATGASAGANPASALDSAAAAAGAAAADDSAEGGGWTQVTGSGGGGGGNNAGGGGSGGGKYVIPRARGAAAGGASSSSGGGSGGLAGVADRVAAAAAAAGGGGGGGNRTDDLNTIRVTNISENTTEADLQELFQVFGRISRVYLAKDKETMVSRGFAFVSFVHKEEAALAMEKLQGYGYDHLILKLEWAKPSAPKDPASAGTEYRSGYGKALAQDTKEKVSYASNLTRGTR